MILWCNSGNIKKSSLLRISDPTAETGNDVEQATDPPPDETTSCLGHSVPALDSMVDSEDDSEPDGKGSLALRKDSFSGSTREGEGVLGEEEFHFRFNTWRGGTPRGEEGFLFRFYYTSWICVLGWGEHQNPGKLRFLLNSEVIHIKKNKSRY